MPFSENSMGQVTTILDFHRLNVMTTLSAEFLSFGVFIYSNLTAVFVARKESEILAFWHMFSIYVL